MLVNGSPIDLIEANRGLIPLYLYLGRRRAKQVGGEN